MFLFPEVGYGHNVPWRVYILLMEDILHRLEWLKPVLNNGIINQPQLVQDFVHQQMCIYIYIIFRYTITF